MADAGSFIFSAVQLARKHVVSPRRAMPAHTPARPENRSVIRDIARSPDARSETNLLHTVCSKQVPCAAESRRSSARS